MILQAFGRQFKDDRSQNVIIRKNC